MSITGSEPWMHNFRGEHGPGKRWGADGYSCSVCRQWATMFDNAAKVIAGSFGSIADFRFGNGVATADQPNENQG